MFRSWKLEKLKNLMIHGHCYRMKIAYSPRWFMKLVQNRLVSLHSRLQYPTKSILIVIKMSTNQTIGNFRLHT